MRAGRLPSDHGGMAEQLPLPALLSQALVAFTIEFDNEFEHRMPHTTTDHGATGSHGGPWLVSMAMWFNCMQFIGEEPMPVAELLRRARTGTNLDGMRRWGYVVLESASGGARRRPPPRDLTIRATRNGHRAQEVWRPLPAVIEDRWRERVGAAGIGGLRASLWALAARAEAEFPTACRSSAPACSAAGSRPTPAGRPKRGRTRTRALARQACRCPC